MKGRGQRENALSLLMKGNIGCNGKTEDKASGIYMHGSAVDSLDQVVRVCQ